MSLTWLVVTVLGPTVLLWNWAFIRLWVGAKHYAGSIPTLLIVMVVTQFVLIRNDANIIDLTLRIRRKVLIGALSVTAVVSRCWVLVSYFKLGIVGLCLGLIGGRSVLSMSYPIMVGRFLKISPCFPTQRYAETGLGNHAAFFTGIKAGRLVGRKQLFCCERVD